MIQRAAKAVLLTGDTGTGKERVAKGLRRRWRTCGALS
jgi:transcriptional regulator with AAA-type ATPase domain